MTSRFTSEQRELNFKLVVNSTSPPFPSLPNLKALVNPRWRLLVAVLVVRIRGVGDLSFGVAVVIGVVLAGRIGPLGCRIQYGNLSGEDRVGEPSYVIGGKLLKTIVRELIRIGVTSLSLSPAPKVRKMWKWGGDKQEALNTRLLENDECTDDREHA